MFVIFLFHSTFAFQACKTCKSPISNRVQPLEQVKDESTDILEEIDQDALASDTTSQDQGKDINIVAIDTFHTSLGYLISGQERSYFDTIIEIEDNFWKDFSENINKDYEEINNKRLQKMATWSSTSFIDTDIDTTLVFYPFSGPDFLHANFLYPNANEYILLALEKVGEVPNLRLLDQEQTEEYLENINMFLRDIYLRSYFITKHMKIDIEKQNKVPGVLSSLYWFLSRTNHQIVRLERVTIDKDANVVIKEKSTGLDGVRFHFIKEGETKVKKLTYFACDISDDGFEEDNPELLSYLLKMRSCNTFVKSASYLMHYRSFSTIRDIILSHSLTIFQDDTGIPYKYFSDSDWNIRCFGTYVKPIPDFEKNYDILYQKDLARRYNQGSERLPFSLGYHWRDASEQNQMLIIQRPNINE